MIASQKPRYIKNALYLSYTSLNDFIKCPRSYYLKNVYRNPENGYKLQIASPHLTLGATVHDTIKWFLDLREKSSEKEVKEKFRNLWRKYSGKRGGFSSKEEEAGFGNRGLLMMENFLKNWPVLEKQVPPISFPKYHLFDDVILIGNFDYVGERKGGSLHVVDFKTGFGDADSPLQLYIYAILAESNLNKPVSAASFWYLDREDTPREIVLDPLGGQLEWIIQKAKEVKEAIEKNEWACIKNDGLSGALCRDCREYQVILDGKGEFMFSDFRFKKDVYYLKRGT